jgi:hypothetical protein
MYKHFIIFKYPNILKFDHEEVAEVDRDIAKTWELNNGKTRPETSSSNQSSETARERDSNVLRIREITNIYKKESNVQQPNIQNNQIQINKTNQNQQILQEKGKTTTMHVKNKTITNIRTIANKVNDKQTTSETISISSQDQINNLNKQIEILKMENSKMKSLLNENVVEIQSLKVELNNVYNMNKEYENQICQLKENHKYDEVKVKLRKEIELWRKEYCDLLEKSMNRTNVEFKKIDLVENFNKERPQSAYSKLMSNHDYETTCREISDLGKSTTGFRRKNSLDDSINNEMEEEIILAEEDDDIEDLLQKSIVGLNTLKTFKE